MFSLLRRLSNISFLHQTTTAGNIHATLLMLSNISFLHQTTTLCISPFPGLRCQISLFYIKPQQQLVIAKDKSSCQISLFYIKPQLCKGTTCVNVVVKYLFSTSNHNMPWCDILLVALSNISFLHQTTTLVLRHLLWLCCQISLFYIKPQLLCTYVFRVRRCQISLFYIKPQPIPIGNPQNTRCQISLFYIKPQP